MAILSVCGRDFIRGGVRVPICRLASVLVSVPSLDLAGVGVGGALIGVIAVFCMVADATPITAGRFITGALISTETCADTRRTDAAIAAREASPVAETAGAALRKAETPGASRAAVEVEHPRAAAHLAA